MATVQVVRKSTNALDPKRKFMFDYWLALAIAGLIVVGVLVVYSTTFDLGMLAKDDSTYYIRRQLIALGIGLVGVLIIMQFDYHVLRYASVPLLGVTLLSLLVLLLVGDRIFGATRGFYEGSFQPSEVAKLATILYIAYWLHTKGERIKMINYGLIPFSVITGVICALIVQQPDLSTAVLIALISFTMFFVAGADWKQFGFVIIVGGSIFLLLMVTLPHAAQRVNDYTTAIRNPELAGWHVQQALIALARGGVFGVGLGESTQKFGPLPAAHTDGAFAILGEELGLAGTLLVVGLLAFMTYRGFRVATRARDSFGFLLAIGVTCWLAYQALINIAVITAVIPFTGMPLPFLSYGGSSLLVTLLGVGILLSVSRDAAITGRERRPLAE
ncbi:MAG: putative peptidoglycan glycosyltransferase FtsW [Chloroflexota bacterium]